MKKDCEYIKNILKKKYIKNDNVGNNGRFKKYNETLILPQTSFEMRAKLPEKEVRNN